MRVTDIIDDSSEEPKQLSLLRYLVPSTLIGLGIATAVIIAVPIGAAVAATGVALGVFDLRI